MSEKRLIIGLEVNTGHSAAEIESVRNAMLRMEGDGAAHADQLARALENASTAQEHVAQKITETGQVSDRDGVKVLRSMATLDQLVREVFGDISQAPEEFQKAFQKAHDGAEQTTQAVRTVNAQVHQQREELTQAGASWDGLGPAINRALGPQGRIVAQGALVVAAFREGINLGTRFAEAIGTNFQAAEDAAHGLKESIKGITNALVTDGLSAAIVQTGAALSNLDDTIVGSGKAMEGFNALVLAGVAREKALTLETQELAAVADAYRLAQEGGAAGLKLFNETVQKTDHSQLANQLGALAAKFRELSIEEETAKAKQEAHTKAVEGSIEAIKKHLQELEAERQAHRLHVDDLNAEILEYQALKKAQEDDATAARLAANVHGGLTDNMRQELQRLLELIPNHDQNTEAIKRWTKALEDDVRLHHDALDPANAKHLEQIIQLTGSLGTAAAGDTIFAEGLIRQALATTQASDKQEHHIQLVRDSKGHWVMLTNTVEEHSRAIEKVNGVYTNLLDEQHGFPGLNRHLGTTNTAVHDLNTECINLGREGSGGFSVATTSVKKLADQLDDLDSHVEATNAKLRELAENALRTAVAIEKIGTASSTAAGGQAGNRPSPAPPNPATTFDPNVFGSGPRPGGGQ
jgi:hypothetical protein